MTHAAQKQGGQVKVSGRERVEGREINTLLCPIIINGNTIELTVHTSCYCLELTLC